MSKKLTIYIAGPMSGILGYNRPAFDEAAEKLRGEGMIVINPSSNYGGDQTLTQEQYMRYSIHQLLIVDAVYMLNNWEFSIGAQCERTVARALGLDIHYE